jgi:hypothetical protein
MGYKCNGLVQPNPPAALRTPTLVSQLGSCSTPPYRNASSSCRRGGATPGLKEWPLSATSPPAPPATTTTTASRQPPPPSGSIASPSPSAPFAPAPAPSPVSDFSPALIVDLLSPLRPPLPAERESPIVLLQRQCARLIPLLAGVYAISSNDIRVGTNVEVDGAPWKVLGDKTVHSSPFLLLSEGYSFTHDCSRICNTVPA